MKRTKYIVTVTTAAQGTITYSVHASSSSEAIEFLRNNVLISDEGDPIITIYAAKLDTNRQ